MKYLNLHFFFGDTRHRMKEKDNQTYLHTMVVTTLKPLQCNNTHRKSTYAIPFKYGTLDGD